MARSENNVLTHGLSGKMGNLIVFRQRAGKTIVSNKPRPSASPMSAAQALVREKFLKGARYAKAAIANPITKAAYEAAAPVGKSGYNMAVKDYFNAPEIGSVTVSGYAGAIGDTVTARVTDDFKVASVTVRIERADATLVEEGAAVLADSGLEWLYTSTAVNASLTGGKVIVIARDLPDNTTTKEVILS